MRAARVTVVVPCVYVCVRSDLPPHTLESQKRDTNGFIAIQEPFHIGEPSLISKLLLPCVYDTMIMQFYY